MKTFDQGYKINFVDDNNVLVGFDDTSSCCERFGWFLSRAIPEEIDQGADPSIVTEGFNFDTKFFYDGAKGNFECGGMVTFKLTKGDEVIYLSLYNSHNGYYSHGFEMVVGGIKIHESSL